MLTMVWKRALALVAPTETLRYYLVLAFYLLAVPVALYVALYAPIPAVHNALHDLRHEFLNVQCH